MAPLLELVAVEVHCDACGQAVTLTGGAHLRDVAKLWSAAHYLPVVASMDLADHTTGAYMGTWRRQEAA